MSQMRILFLCLVLSSACQGQNTASTPLRSVGGPCEDCQALNDYRQLGYSLSSVDTLPGFAQNQPHLRITGTVYQRDGETPAAGTILYVYHTNREGIYQASDQPIGWENRHGQHRGWMKTDALGRFTFYTFRPAAYPDSREPEHIHIYVKEPDTQPYFLNSYVFADDPLLTPTEQAQLPNRGGSGVITLTQEKDLLVGHRDIILGLHIPDY